MTTYARAARLWTGQRWVDDALVAIDEDRIRPVSAAPSVAGSLEATLLPPLTDCHVHIGLSDFVATGGGALARALDLGWDPAILSTVDSSAATMEVAWAGPFLTAPGGYPSDRSWAAAGSWTNVADSDQAVGAVASLAARHVSVIKVALNANAGPVFADDVLRAIVEVAHEHRLPVVAHVEGQGQAERAVAADVDWFAHAPWEHRMSESELQAMVGRVGWISTLDMHGRGRYGEDYAIAVENVDHFHALGGRVVYGTDLGNAITSTDLNVREVAALTASGMAPAALLRALIGHELLPRWSRTVTRVPVDVRDAQDAIDALPTSRPVTAAMLMKELS